jgi:SAM-dependent methyltransferase
MVSGTYLRPPTRTAVRVKPASTRIARKVDEVIKLSPSETKALTTPQPIDNSYDHVYWYDPRIHNWGHLGLRGWFHATFAPLATYVIDRLSYSGMDVRAAVLQNETYFPPGATVLDLGCGTGFSTAKGALGVDTSPPMLRVAQGRRPDARFGFGNAESYGEPRSYDTVSCMFCTHEMPVVGRRRVLRNAMRVARKSVVVVDIDPDFEETLRAKPGRGASFLAGEPYVLQYLETMDEDVNSCVRHASYTGWQGARWKLSRHALLEKHVVVWHLERMR